MFFFLQIVFSKINVLKFKITNLINMESFESSMNI